MYIPKDGIGAASVHTTQRPVHAVNLDAITRFDAVHQIPVQNHVDGARQLPSRCLLRHLLNRDGLVVDVLAEPEFRLQWIAIRILGGVRAAGGHLVAQHRRVLVLAHPERLLLGLVVHALADLWADQGACDRCRNVCQNNNNNGVIIITVSE